MKKTVSLLGGGLHIYLKENPPKARMVPYVLLGGGNLFHLEDGTYKGRGPGFFGGMGWRITPRFGVETRYMGGAARETDRSLDFNSLQIVMVLATK